MLCDGQAVGEVVRRTSSSSNSREKRPRGDRVGTKLLVVDLTRRVDLNLAHK